MTNKNGHRQVTLDALDRKLLQDLELRGRDSFSEIARRVRRGRDTVEYRIRELEEKEIITGYHAIIDPSAVGLSIFKTYVRLRGPETAHQKVSSLLSRHPRVFWLAECCGSYDYIFSIHAHSLREFADIQQQILDKLGDVVVALEVFPLVEMQCFARGYLGERKAPPLVIGASSRIHLLEETDRRLLSHLAKNARATIASLAEEAEVAPNTAKKHVLGLEKNGVILGYRAALDIAKLELEFFKAQIALDEFRTSDIQKILAFCKKEPHITYFIRQVGSCLVEIELEVFDYYHCHEVLSRLRAEVPDAISHITTTLIRKEEYRWAPSGW
jgi:Lrp/AsnC family leucine-responsive transcriptional regulator